MRITPILFLRWLLATTVMVLAVRYVGGDLISWENVRFYGGRSSLYGMASRLLVVIAAGWLIVLICSTIAAWDGRYSLEGVIMEGTGWFLMLIVPLWLYASRL